ncbi:DUF4309 domain-containing protein [Bacillus infantis]|uniref:DUF4309 domain-containing protein n=1 Tax=Bacillus infantis TaxID=324767 RepID=UPI003CF33217
MNKYIYAMLMVLSMLTAACSNQIHTSLAEEISHKTEKQKDDSAILTIQTEGKDKKDTSWLKEKSLYRIEAADEGLAYEVYIYAENETTVKLEQAGVLGDKQDTVHEGNYSVYMAKKGAKSAFKQDILSSLPLVFNEEVKGAYPLKLGDKTLLAIVQPEGDSRFSAELYSIQNGELKIVQSGEGIRSILGPEIKAIKQEYIQTVNSIDDNEGWVFSTWAFDKEKLEIKQVSETVYDDSDMKDGLGEGEKWFEIWSAAEENYHPFYNIQLEKGIIDKASQGILTGSQYPIGTNINDVKKASPPSIESGKKGKYAYLKYPEVTYFYDEATQEVAVVSIPGIRLQSTLADIKKMFGEPFRESRRGTEVLAIYAAGKYNIDVYADQSGKIKSVQLRKL